MENSNEEVKEVEEITEEAVVEQESSESTVDEQGRKLYKVTCAECKKETTVPFEPDGVRPVFCKTCLMAKRNAQR